MACKFIVSGIIEYTKGELTSSLNFGNGSCDDIAVLTDSDGVETEITLKRRMH